MRLPEQFRRTVTETYPGGALWLQELPGRIEEISRRWLLSVGSPFPNLSFNFVAPVSLPDTTEAVLKLGPPNTELSSEIEVLRIYDGNGCVRLLAAEPDAGAVLMERLRPGAMLATLENDEIATNVAANIMRKLWRPLPTDHLFPTLTRWFQALTELRCKFDGGTGPIPPRLFAEAESLFRDLISSHGESVLLHGDIHHFNILSAHRALWLAIDPKGIAGEREFDTAQFLLNPWPKLLEQPDPDRILARRIDQFSEELGFDRARIRGWGICNAVLSACWDAEKPNCNHRYDLEVAERLSGLGV